jgi:hypothetical protein
MQNHELNAKHFPMLRIAKLRNLKVRKIGAYYAVTSHTHRRDGLEYVASLDGCSCPAKGYCTHVAAAVDYHFINEASPTDYGQYTNALISDRTQLRLRIRANELTRNDKVYLAFCERFYRNKLAKAEAAKVSTPAITKTAYREGGRVRTVERVGPYVI